MTRGRDRLVDVFDNCRNALADADAHGSQAVAAAASLHFVHQGGHDAGAAATERVA